MKIRANRAQLAEALAWVAGAISKRPAHAALAGVRLVADGDELTLRAFDYLASHEMRLQVEVGAEGECLVSGQFLREMVAALRGVEVDLEYDDNARRLTVASGRATYRCSGLDATDFPALPPFPKVRGEVDHGALAQAVGFVKHAPNDGGDYDHLKGLRIESVTADGVSRLHVVGLRPERMAVSSMLWRASAEDFACQALVVGVVAAVKGMSGTVTIGYSGGRLGLRNEHRTVTLGCFDEEYPRWRAAVPDPLVAGASCDVDVDELAGALKRTSLLMTVETAVWLSITDQEVVIDIDVEGSEGSEGVIADEISGEGAARVNPRMLGDALGALSGGTVRVYLPEARNYGVVLRPADHPSTCFVVAKKPGTKGTS